MSLPGPASAWGLKAGGTTQQLQGLLSGPAWPRSCWNRCIPTGGDWGDSLVTPRSRSEGWGVRKGEEAAFVRGHRSARGKALLKAARLIPGEAGLAAWRRTAPVFAQGSREKPGSEASGMFWATTFKAPPLAPSEDGPEGTSEHHPSKNVPRGSSSQVEARA